MKYFNLYEFKCKCGKCGDPLMDPAFLEMLDTARGISDVAYTIVSGYRCPDHNRLWVQQVRIMLEVGHQILRPWTDLHGGKYLGGYTSQDLSESE
jgi:hypothetical protein